MALECRVESKDLPAQTRSELESWVARVPLQNGSGAIRKKGTPVPAGASPGVDLFRYELEIDREGSALRYTFDDATLPEPLAPLIDFLCDYLEPAGDGFAESGGSEGFSPP